MHIQCGQLRNVGPPRFVHQIPGPTPGEGLLGPGDQCECFFCFRMDFLLMLEDDDLSIFELLHLFDRCFKDAFKPQSHKLRLQCISQGMFGNSTDSHAWSGLV